LVDLKKNHPVADSTPVVAVHATSQSFIPIKKEQVSDLPTLPDEYDVFMSTVDAAQPLKASTMLSHTLVSDTLPDWGVMLQKMQLRGLVKQLGQQSELIELADNLIKIRCENRSLASNVVAVSGLEKALNLYFKDAPKRLEIQLGQAAETPAKAQVQVKQKQLEKAQSIIANDLTIKALIHEFDGMILPNSIKGD
jgi:hypothetical protein